MLLQKKRSIKQQGNHSKQAAISVVTLMALGEKNMLESIHK